jgi:3-oxoadipate CoA-transferase alpha subunit
MINKVIQSADEAVADIHDGAVLMIGGFGPAGQPTELLDALIRLGPRDLTLISNNAGNGDYGLAALLKAGCVRKIICSFPRQTDSWVFDQLYREKKIELELVPQGNLVARIQAGGSGIAALYTPTAYGIHYVLETALKADFSLIKALHGDRWGNLTFNKTGRNFGPIMAAASKCTLAQVDKLVALGEIDPENVITPGIFVKRVVQVHPQPVSLTA